MQPFERLRYLARWAGDDDALVSEAADCLAGFADDPAGLVVACRRLLAHHVASGPLWWLCSRVLCASDAADAAWEAVQLLEEDRTASRLADALPFPHDAPIAVLGWGDTVADALTTRSDLDVVAVRLRGARRVAAQVRRAARPVRLVSEVEAGVLGATHLLVEASAVGGSSALVPYGAQSAAEVLMGDRPQVWVVAGLGRALPDRLYDALRTRLLAAATALESASDDDVDELPL
ncbi:MAG: hypothetical protein JOZ99_05625, partial [Actinobacteria bacterium]|nr:hypothetical protein [Actinomycetota bacterium]